MSKYKEALEKAKAYDEALELMRDCVPDEDGLVHVRPSDIFSELAESGDERIRKEIISYFKQFDNEELRGVDISDWIAWLEKLKVFAEHGDGLYHFGNNCFTYVGNPTWDNVSWLEKQGTSYTKRDVDDAYLKGISDAKSELEKQSEQKPTQETEPFEAEHGEYYYCIKDYFCGGKKQASKGDVVQALRGLAIMGLKDASEYFLPVNSIKCNSAWTEKDSTMAFTLMRDVDQMSYVSKEGKNERIGWLNSLDEKFVSTESSWSEEDEKMYRGVMAVCDVWSTASSFYPKEIECVERLKNWLKSLKTRITWKPSDEQMEALEHFIIHHNGSTNYAKDLEELRIQLKKLKGE